MDLIRTLEMTLSEDKTTFKTAKQILTRIQQTNFQEYLTQLADIIQGVYFFPAIRQSAAIEFASVFTFEDDFELIEQQHKWLSLHEHRRLQIKKNIVRSLGIEIIRPSKAAKCISVIAAAEFPHNQWPEIITILRDRVTKDITSDSTKEAAIQAIGYICSDIASEKCREVMESNTREIYVAVTFGLKYNKNSDIKSAARIALISACEWIWQCMQSDEEKRLMLVEICECGHSEDNIIRIAALKCLLAVLSKDYSYIKHFMESSLFAVMTQAINCKFTNVKILGIELCKKLSVLQSEWNTMPTNEINEVNQNIFSVSPVTFVLPMLIESLIAVEDTKMSSSLIGCLTSVIVCHKNWVTKEYVKRFAMTNVGNVDWRYRKAAIGALSALFIIEMDGLQLLLKEAFPILIDLMFDANVNVQASAASAIGKVCTLIGDGEIDLINTNIPRLVLVLLNSLDDCTTVAMNACETFYHLAIVAKKFEKEDLNEINSNCLGQFYESIVQKIFQTMIRQNGTNDLRKAARCALVKLFETVPKSCYTILLNTAVAIMNCLESFKMHLMTAISTPEENDLLVNICSTLRGVLNQLKPEDACQITSNVIHNLMQIFNLRNNEINPNRRSKSLLSNML